MITFGFIFGFVSAFILPIIDIISVHFIWKRHRQKMIDERLQAVKEGRL